MSSYTKKCLMAVLALPLLASCAPQLDPKYNKPLVIRSESFAEGKPLATRFAFCAPSADGKAGFGDGGNRSPHLGWTLGPGGTRSYAVIMHDNDVPRDYATLANKDGVVIPEDAPRVRFNHWVLVDIPANVNALPERADSLGVRKGGKNMGKSVNGKRGQNDYARYLNNNSEWHGEWGGYDGPCPPWNDNRVHRYVFTVYALNVPELKLGKKFSAPAALKAMEGHVLAEGKITGTYTLNAFLRSQQ